MGGAQRVAINLIRKWRERGWDITIVVTYSGRGSCYFEIPAGVEVIYLADLIGGWRGRLMDRLRRALALRRLLKQRQPQRVVSFLWDANIFTLVAARGLEIQVVVSERNYPYADAVPWLHAKARLLLYPYSACVVLQTSRGLDWAAQTMPRARGKVIPNPIALPLPVTSPTVDPATSFDAATKIILGVGRLTHAKGFDVLIDAFASVADQNQEWQLAILGEGPERTSLERQVRHLGLEGRIHLKGAAGNVSDWYQRADIFVMASRYEGFPNALLEAMAHGCPVISFDCDTGPADMISSQEYGVLLGRSPDATQLAAALASLISDEQRRKRLGNAALEVRERYSIDAIIADWDQALALPASGGNGSWAG